MALTKITSRILDSSGVTILGTIATGVWQGTPINQTYLVGQSGTNTGDETLARINALDVTELGTISSGVWNGTVIASAYLDADTAHLSTTQTFTGAKTFSSNAIFTGNVGIGTASPGAKLHNYSTATTNVFITGYGTAAQNNWQAQNAFFVKTDNGILISKENANNNTNRLFNFYNNASAEASMHMYRGGSTSYIKLDTNGDSYLNGGNVGIGTASPISGFKLDVQGGDFRVGDDANQGFEAGYSAGSGNVFLQGYNRGTSSFVNMILNNALTISSGGEYSFGTPNGVTYGHGSNDGFHLRTGLELGFGNGNNNRPDFGINATGSGGGASLNIYCGEGSDDIDIQISPAAVMQFNSGGIKFGSNEALDTYDEGTFSPNLQKNDSSGSGQLSSGSQTRVGRYVRVGNQVAIWIYIYMSAANAPATTHNTSWLVQGLPFTFRGSTPYQFLPCGYAMISGTQVNQHVRLQINNNTDSGIIYARHTIDSNNNNGNAIEFTFAGVLEIN